MEWFWAVIIAAVCAIAACVIIFVTKRLKKGDAAPVTIDNVVGSKCVVDERIDAEAGCGQVIVGGQSWSARAVDADRSYEVGETLRVVAIEGVKLICRK